MKLIGIEDSEFCHFCGFLSYIYEGAHQTRASPQLFPGCASGAEWCKEHVSPPPITGSGSSQEHQGGGDGVARQHPDRLGMRGCSVLSRGDVEHCQMKQSRSIILNTRPPSSSHRLP